MQIIITIDTQTTRSKHDGTETTETKTDLSITGLRKLTIGEYDKFDAIINDVIYQHVRKE